MKIEQNENLIGMLRHLAKDQEKLNAVVESHAGGQLTFRVDDTIQLGVKVDAKKGLKKGQVIQIVLADLSIESDDKTTPVPASVVPKSSPSRGCGLEDKAEMKALYR